MTTPTKLNGWVSQLYRQQLESTPRTSPDQIPASREFFGIHNFPHLLEGLPAGVRTTEDIVLRSRDGYDVVADVYAPLEGEGPFPTIVWIHGGSWALMTRHFLKRLGMQWTERGFVVLNIDYGLAPEHPYPAALEDTIYAMRWAAQNIAEYGGRPDRFFTGGESAGANLAAAAVLALTDPSGELLEGLDEGELAGVPVTFGGTLLFCGIFDFPLLFAHPGSLSTTGFIETTWNLAYLGPNFVRLHRDPRVSPAYSPNLGLFPPSYLNCGSVDALLPQTLSFTQQLADAGVHTTVSIVGGADHEYMLLPDVVPEGIAESERIVTWMLDRAAEWA